ncbi:hypothetical protein E6C27_scaffold2487G00020 [Cucumis melo var. makuwa]|uniref:Uncharacterized protein n=1 Tax=Cucumis melo var. makuwa TaxID=1194695 RepID=A0A5A7T9K5_CUCMM|nr:hypothetical protein E6C27_scaffold2487G00020 [Cucumis melo var. makuwa]
MSLGTRAQENQKKKEKKRKERNCLGTLAAANLTSAGFQPTRAEAQPQSRAKLPRPFRAAASSREVRSRALQPSPSRIVAARANPLVLQSALVHLHLFWTSLLGKHTCLAIRTRRVNLQVHYRPACPRCSPRNTEDQIFVPTGSHVARVRERARDWVEAEVGAKASWRATRSDRGEP